ncbi:hypothetical protein PybrP1_005932 [[Pythium] brassicae (nom. inval.)]|nr:hypothetical protein PybrP1_005932 [[Pythium] brassicae (nom. inval.)]
MTHAKEVSQFLKPTEGRLDVFVANGARLEVRSVGDDRFGVGGGKTVLVTGVLYVPELDCKLLSVSALTAKGAQVEFQQDSCVIKRNGEVIIRGCARGKMTVAQFAYTSGSVVKSSSALEIVHSDLMGPMETVSNGGARYVLVFVDDWSRFKQVYLL